MTTREIAEELPGLGCARDDGKPWSDSTVAADVQAIDQEFRERVAASIDSLKGAELLKLLEIEREAWRTDKLDLALKTLAQRCKLLGLDAPSKQEMSGPGGGPVQFIFPKDMVEGDSGDSA